MLLGHRKEGGIDGLNVMNARSTPIGWGGTGLPPEEFLGMASNLGRSLGHHIIPRYAPPVSFSILV